MREEINLTPREREVYCLVVEQGMQQKDIALAMGTSVNTAKKHIQGIFNKVGTGSCLELTVWHYTRGTA